MAKAYPKSVVLVAALAALLPAGCLTRRQEARLTRQPTNRVFQPGQVEPLRPGETHAFGEFDRGGTQNLCVLRLAPDAALKKRYHKAHDLTLFVVAGSAIVMVEETRYFVEPGAAVVLPRYTAYQVMPHESEEDFVGLLVYSPPLDEKGAAEDTFLED